MSRKTKLVLGACALLLVGGLVLSVLRGADRAVPVRLAEVGERDLVSTVTATGKVRARRAVEISSDVMGRVTRLAVDEGDEVERGDVLLEIDRTQFEAAVSRARASLSQARSRVAQERAGLLQAERELERVRGLWNADPPVVPRRELDDAETRVEVQRALLESAEHGVEQAEAALQEALNDLDKTTIRAPMAGTVTRRDIDEGETAVVGTMNNPGSLLLTVSDLATVEAVMTVDETDLPAISLGDSAAVRVDAFPGSGLHGTVTRVGNSAVRQEGAGQDGSTVEFEVIVALEDPDIPLRPDLSGTADIVTAVREDALAVPIIAVTVRDPEEFGEDPGSEEPGEPDEPGESAPVAAGSSQGASALFARDDDEPVEGVFVVRDGVARFTPVELGITGREHFEVLSGLSPGDTVVRGPYQTIRTLRDGDRVRAMGQPG